MQSILALQSLEIEATDALDAELAISTYSVACCVVGTDRPYYLTIIIHTP